MILNYDGFANKPVIYMIYNMHSHGMYIGQTRKCQKRWRDGYKRILPKGTCHNTFLQNDFTKCFNELGHTDFLEFHVLKVMENSTHEERINLEVQFIKFFRKMGYRIYNATKEFNGNFALTDKTKLKISQAKKEYYKTDAGKALIKSLSDSKRGKSYEEYYGKEEAAAIKKKISENKLIEQNRPEVKENLRKQLLGKTSIERFGMEKAQKIKEKRSLARKGKYTGKDSSGYTVREDIKLMSPTGEVFTKVDGIMNFGTEHGIPYNRLGEILANKRENYKGWYLIKTDC